MSRIVLAMSGGVDSSVAAHLLRRDGHEVIGIFMRHGESVPGARMAGEAKRAPRLPMGDVGARHKQGCCSAADANDARRVADKLDIAFYAVNFEKEFRQIIDYFVDEYAAARTPNPCVVCNNWLKFGKLFEYADAVGAEHVATGHYARVIPTVSGNGADATSNNKPPALCRGLDHAKDQSYLLFGIDRHRLARIIFPLGVFRKQEIRRTAQTLSLPVAAKKDSQEICFVVSGKHDEFVRARRPGVDTSGQIVDTRGSVLGYHSGIERFTVGQRKGLGVALGRPRFVVRIEADTRRVVVGTKDELARRELTAGNANWLVDPPSGPSRCAVQIRYNSSAVPAIVEVLPDDRIRVVFDEPCLGVAPGQAVVCYDGNRVLGGAWIEQSASARCEPKWTS